MISKLLSKITIIMNVIKLREIFYTILYMSVFAIIVGLVIYLIQELLDKRISPKWKLAMWTLFIFSLIIPINTSNQYESRNLILSTLRPIQEISFRQEVDDKKAEYENYIQREDTTFSEYKIVRGNLYIAYAKYIIFDFALPCIWCIGVILIFIRKTIAVIGINLRIKNEGIEDKRLNKILEQCKKTLNIKAKIRLVNLEKAVSPSIYGIIKTKVLINKNIIEEKTDDEIRYMFLHELSHKKGKDLILNFVLNIIKTIHYFNPFCYIFFKRIRQDIELKADSIALKTLKPEENKQYAMTIINELASRVYKSYEVEVLQLIGIEGGIERRIYMIKYFPQFKQRTIRIAIICLFLIGSIGTIFLVGKYVRIEKDEFSFDYKSVIPYQTKYVGDFEKVKTLTKKLAMGSYVGSIKTQEIEGKYYLYVSYFSYNIEKANQFFSKFNSFTEEKQEQILRKNALALLSLVDNLYAVQFRFEIPDSTLPSNKVIYQKEFNRDELEKYYNVDLRTYKYNPQS